MKYKAENELNNFSFHDAEIRLIEFKDGSMRWQVSSLNVTTKNSQNNHDNDMCIKDADIIFENVCIENIIFSAYKTLMY